MGSPSALATTSPGWCFPALFNTGEKWLLITESDLDAGYVGSRLAAEPTDNTYRVTPPLPAEGEGIGAVEPAHRLPWLMPWRVIIVGETPGEVAESDLVDDLATPTRLDDIGWVRPGRVSWSWWSDHDSPKTPHQSLPLPGVGRADGLGVHAGRRQLGPSPRGGDAPFRGGCPVPWCRRLALVQLGGPAQHGRGAPQGPDAPVRHPKERDGEARRLGRGGDQGRLLPLGQAGFDQTDISAYSRTPRRTG